MCVLMGFLSWPVARVWQRGEIAQLRINTAKKPHTCIDVTQWNGSPLQKHWGQHMRGGGNTLPEAEMKSMIMAVWIQRDLNCCGSCYQIMLLARDNIAHKKNMSLHLETAWQNPVQGAGTGIQKSQVSADALRGCQSIYFLWSHESYILFYIIL